MTFTFGSLFAGIGGFDLGLERAGMECRWQVEIDPYCQRVLAKHWPEVPRYADIRELDTDSLERVDLICGGFPCQDIASAGRRTGIEGERSGLWSEFARVVRRVRPRYVLVENTPGLLVRGMGDVLGDLASMGYDAEWQCVPAAAIGAHQLRARVWILAHAGGERGAATDSIPAGWRESVVCAWRPRAEPDVDRVADGLPGGMDRVRALGNAVVPQIAEWLGHRILEHSA
jgi:DNA (cytosine-5)-methyltransferase 1